MVAHVAKRYKESKQFGSESSQTVPKESRRCVQGDFQSECAWPEDEKSQRSSTSLQGDGAMKRLPEAVARRMQMNEIVKPNRIL